jgi:arylsulfatase A-like enzyme
LPQLAAERGYQTTLVTDEPQLTQVVGADGFGNCVQVVRASDARAEEIPQTALARLFSAACTVIESPQAAPQLVWVHGQGMCGPWDAPLTLQRSLLDEEDPPPIESIAPPDLSIADTDDPDTVFRYSVAYAAQVMVLDACWQVLGDALPSAGGGNEWLVMLLGARGQPLGEHGKIGGIDRRLYIEQLQVPWLIRFPDKAGRLARSSQLVSQLDLTPTIVDWFDGGGGSQLSRVDGRSVLPLVAPQAAAWRDALVCGDSRQRRAIRTPAWSLLYEPSRGAEKSELFVRPDDRWEANNVAALCPEIVDGLVAASEAIAKRIEVGEDLPNDPLAEELRTSFG